MYRVVFVGGDRDGEIIAAFDDERASILFAYRFYSENENDFDPVCGGLMIIDPDDNDLENW